MKKFTLTILAGLMAFSCVSQKRTWNNKTAAVVLTYDDAIDVNLDKVIPSLDSLGLKGTFYLIGASGAVSYRIAEWRVAAQRGHELGNHSLFHPCTGGPGREFVTSETDLRSYTVDRAVKEIRLTNTLLKAIDGKDARTFAYPCGDQKIGNDFFYKGLTNDFVAARGVTGAMNQMGAINMSDINSYMMHERDADHMIDLVKKAVNEKALLVFMFHGVGGGHSLNVSLAAHNGLIKYLKAQEKDIWVATMVDVAQYIKTGK